MALKLIPKCLKGKVMPWHTFDVRKWGLTKYDDPEFSSSFSKARKSGAKEFVWQNNNRYSTKTSDAEYENLKKLGLTNYNSPEFSDAFKTARNNGEKEFVWKNGNRYNTLILDKEHENQYASGIRWIQDYYKNLPEENITPVANDSINASFTTIEDSPRLQQVLAKRDSLKNIFEKDPDWNNAETKYGNPKFTEYFNAVDEANSAYDEDASYKANKLDSIYKRLPADIKQGYIDRSLKLNSNEGPKLIPTQLPDKSYKTGGYYDPNSNKIYTFVDGAIPEHEFNHYVTHKRSEDLIPKRKGLYTKGLRDEKYANYVMEPSETASRNIEVRRMLSKKYPDISPYKKIDEATYNKIKKNIGMDAGKNLLYSTWETFNDNYNNDLVK